MRKAVPIVISSLNIRTTLRQLTLLVFLLSATSGIATPCREYLAQIVNEYHRALLGETENPVSELRRRFGNQIFNKDIPGGLSQLEDDAFALIRTPPEFRTYDAMQEKYGLSKQEAQDIVDFYALVFYRDARLVHDVHKSFARAAELHRVHWLNDSRIPIVRRHRYYLANLTLKSVPEIARDLGLPEGTVYQELGLLGISIVDEFGGARLARAQQMYDMGVSLPTIAAELKVGEQALAFVLHHTSDRNRGVGWNRLFVAEDRPISELQFLVRLFDEGLSHQEIAARINQKAGVLDPNDPDIRTAASVAYKLKELGLTENRRPKFASNIQLDNYGMVKQSGQLVPGNAIRFLIDHRERPLAWLANSLGISEAGLKHFIAKHHVRISLGTKSGNDGENSDDIIGGYADIRRNRALSNFLRVVTSRGNLPRVVRTRPDLSPEEVAERRAYNWMFANKGRTEAMAKLPKMWRDKIAEWAAQAETTGLEKFLQVVERTDGLPRPIQKKKSELSADELLEKNAYTWMVGNHDRKDVMEELPKKWRDKIAEWAVATEGRPGHEKFLDVVNRTKQLPKPAAGGVRKKTANISAEDVAERNAYAWMQKYHDTPREMAKLPREWQDKIGDWAKQIQKGPPEERFMEVVNRLGRLPKNIAKSRQTISELERAEHHAYRWMSTNWNLPNIMGKLPKVWQDKIAEWAENAQKPGDEKFLEVVGRTNSLPKTSSKGKAKLSEDELVQKRAYSWMRKNHNKPEEMAKLPLEWRDKIAAWAAEEKKPLHERFLEVVKRTGKLPKSYSKKKEELSDEELSENYAYNWMAHYHDRPDVMAKLPKEWRDKIDAWAIESRKSGSEKFLEVVTRLGQFPKTYGKKKAEMSPAEIAEANAYAWLQKNYDRPETMAKLPKDLQDQIARWAAQKPPRPKKDKKP